LSTTLPRSLALLLALAALAPAARAADQHVTINPELAGAWLTPTGSWDGRAVLFLHGFADDMDGAGDLTKHTAEALARGGIASLRINFRGEGDRKRTDIRSTLQTRVEDAAAAYAFLLHQAGVQAARLGVVGWSLGTATEIETLGTHPSWFKSGIVWSSLAGDLGQFALTMPGAQQALKDGVTTQDAGWKKITTYRNFYESFRGVDLDALLAKYPGAFLAIRGSNDFLPNRDAELVKAAPGQPVEAVLIGGADHIFNVLAPSHPHADHAVSITVRWMERTL